MADQTQVQQLAVTSEDFEEGGELPARAAHGMAGGENRSPHLAWSGVPDGTKSIAVTCWDPDAPTTVGFSHWVRVGIPPDVSTLPAGAGAGSGPGQEGLTDFGQPGYGGMAPPEGDPPHHYQFSVWALDAEPGELGIGDTATYAMFRFLIRGHVLASGTITGLFAAG